MESGIVKLVVVGDGVVKGTTVVQAHGQATRIKAAPGQKFILVDGGSGTGPQNVTIHREGKNLHVSLQGTPTGEAEIVIVDYYEGGGADKALVGLAEDGNYYSYVPADAQYDHYVATLGEWGAAAQVLGTGAVTDIAGVAGLAGAVGASTASLMSAGAFSMGSLAILSGFAAIGVATVENGRSSSSDNSGPTVGAQPVINEVLDNVGKVTGPIPNGGYTDDTTPTLNGHGTPGTQVQIIDNGKVIGTVTVGPDGTWTYTTDPLGEGRHTIVAQPEGGGPPTSVVVVVDTTAPALAQNLSVIDHVGTSTGPIASNGVTDDGKPTFSGTAEAGAKVVIRDNDQIIATVTVGTDGTWSYTPTDNLSEGAHSLTAEVVDGAGNGSGTTTPIKFTVDAVGPATPVIGNLIDHQGTVTGPVTRGTTIDDPRPTLSGTAEAGSTITIRDRGAILGTTVVDSAGNWTFTPAEPLINANHSLTVEATDGYGRTSTASSSFDFGVLTGGVASAVAIVNVIDDVGPLVNISPGGLTNDTTPTLRGTAQAGSTVRAYDGATLLGTTIADANGQWSITPTVALGDGTHNLTAAATSATGVVSPVTGIYSIRVDGTAPSPAAGLVLTDKVGVTGPVTNGGLTDDATPTLSGTAEPGSTVSISDNGRLLGTALVNASGIWSYTPTQELSKGAHALTVVVTDAAGNDSQATAPFNFSVDNSAVTIAINRVADNTGIYTGGLQPGGVTDALRPVFSGTGVVGGVVKLYDENNAVRGTTTIDGTGHWSITPTSDLVGQGTHSFRATVTTAAAGESAPTAVFSLVLDTVAPAPPVISGLKDDVGADQGTITAGGSTDDMTPTLFGTAEAGSKITVSGPGGVLGTTITDSTGNWSFTPASPLNPNSLSFTATATDSAGNTSLPSNSWASVVTTAPAIPLNAVLTDDALPGTGTITNGSSTNDTTPIFSGTAEAGATITVRDNGNFLGTTVASSNGVWSFTSPTLAGASHSFTAQAANASGSSAQTAAIGFTIDTVAPGAPLNATLTDDFGTVTGTITNGSSTDDQTPTFAGTAEAGALITIRDNGNILGTTVATSSGTWSFTSPTLTGPSHSFTAQATDAATNASAETTAIAFTLITTTPAIPLNVALTDDVLPGTGTISNGGSTNDTTPTISGLADAGALITIRDNGNIIGTTIASSSGVWSFTPAALSTPSHSFTAQATTASGTSAQTTAIGFTLDTVAPATPTSAVLTDDFGTVTGTIGNLGSTDDQTPTFSGFAEVGATITIRDNGNIIGTTIASSSGVWSFTSPTLSGPNHSFTAQATDSARNASSETTAIAFTLITTTPAIPLSVMLTDDTLPGTGTITNGGSTNDTTPTISGTGDVGSTITLRDNGNVIGTTTVGSSGTWTFTPSALGGASHSITAQATTAAGSSAQTTPIGFTLDTQAPTTPSSVVLTDDFGTVTGTITAGNSTDDATPTVTGLAEAGALITIRDNGNILGTTVAGSNGVWSFTSPTLSGPNHSFTAQATDSASNASSESTAIAFTLISGGQAAPLNAVLTDDVLPGTGTITNGSSTNDTTPIFSGTADVGATITIRDNGNVLGTTTAGSNGVWSFTSPVLAGPSHSFTAQATTAAGSSAQTTAIGFTLDTAAPGTPLNAVLTDDFGTVTGAITNGSSTDDTTPTFAGTAEAGALITIRDNGNILGTTIASSSGTWSFTSPTLTGPSHSFTAQATDAATNASAETTAIAFTLITTTPATPLNAVLTDDVLPGTGTISNGGSTNDTTPTFSGLAEAGATITIRDNGNVIGTTLASSGGVWSFTSPTLSTPSHSFTAQATNASGASAQTTAIGFTLDTVAPGTPTSAVLTDDFGTVTGEITSGSSTDDQTPTFSGFAEAGATVTIRDNGNILGTTIAGSNGVWSFTSPTLTGPSHSFTAQATDAARNASSETTAIAFTLTTATPGMPLNVMLTDDTLPGTGTVGNGGATNDTTPTISGTADVGATITIRDNDNVIGTTTVGSSGTWTFTPSALVGASHSITAQATTAAGTSAQTTPIGFTIDTVAPVAPSSLVLIDDFGTVTGTITTGNSTDDATPTITGLAEAGATITIRDNGNILGTTVAGSNGVWSFTSPTLSGPSHSITAQATDSASNASSETTAIAFNLVTGAPGTPVNAVLTDNVLPGTGTIGAGGSTNDTMPVFSGTADIGSTITIRDNGNVIGTTTVGSNGVWSFTSPALSNPSHSFTAQASNASGVSAQTTAIGFTLDTVAPGTPLNAVLTDDFGAATGTITNGSSTDDTTPTFAGTAEAGALITIRDNDSIIGTTLANSSGAWSFTSSTLSGPSHSFTAQATDSAKNASAETTAIAFTLITTTPATPMNAVLTDDVLPGTGTISNGGSTNDTTPTFSGLAEAGATITIRDNGNVIGTTTAGGNGVWSFTSPTLSTPSHSFTAQATNAANSVSTETTAIGFTLDTAAPMAPTSAVLTDNFGTVTGPITSGGSTDDTKPIFSGLAEAGATITIRDNGNIIGTTIASSGGVWSFTSSTLSGANHAFTAQATDSAKNASSETTAIAFTLITNTPSTPLNAVLTDDVLPGTGTITNGGSTNDTTPTFSGVAEVGSTITVRDNGNVIGTTTTNGSGAWTFTPAALLSGSHSFTAQATNAANSVSTETTAIGFTVDTVVPGTPTSAVLTDDFGTVTGTITNGSSTDDATPTFSGLAEAGATITIRDNDSIIGTTVANSNGVWSFTASTLSGASHSFTAQATDSAKNAGSETTAIAFTLTTTTPSIPLNVLLTDDVLPGTGTITNGGSTNDTTPTISGTGDVGSTITLRDNGNPIGSTTVGSSGTWTFTPSALVGASHSITAQATNASGTSSQTTAISFTLVTAGPGVPVNAVLIDDFGTVTGAITTGTSTDDQTPTMSGTADVGSTITIHDNGNVIGTTTVSSSGTWSFTSPTLTSGSHAFTAQATNAAGTSAETTAISFNLTTSTPALPLNVLLTDDVLPGTGTIANGGSTNDTTPTISGTGDVGSTITLRDNNNILGTTTVGSSGTWTFTPSALAGGSHSITAQASNASGSSSQTTAIGFTLFTAAPGIPLSAILTDDFGTVTGAITSGGSTDDQTPTMSGTADVGSTITIHDNGNVIGTTTVNSSGAWSFTSPTLTSGSHAFTAQATNAAGTSAETTAISFNLVTATAALPLNVLLTDDVLPGTGTITGGGFTNDATPTISGTGDVGSTITLRDNSNVIGTTTVGSSGTWTFTPSALVGASHSITAQASNAFGSSAQTTSIDFTLDTVAPLAPASVALIDDLGTITGPITNGSFTNDATPVFSGTAEAGSTITIRDNGNVLGTTTANSSGAWTFTPAALSGTGHSFTAQATDSAKNASTETTAIGFTLDTVAPDAPLNLVLTDAAGSVTGPVTSGGSTDDTRPTLSGTAEAGSTITVSDGTTVLGTTTASASGAWSFMPPAAGALANGAHTLAATATDSVGNASSASTFAFTVAGNQAPTLATTALVAPDGLLPNTVSYGTLLVVPNIEGPISGSVPAGWTSAASTPDTVNPGTGTGPYGAFGGTVIGGSFSGNAIGFGDGENVGLALNGLTAGLTYTLALEFQNPGTGTGSVTISENNSGTSQFYSMPGSAGWVTKVFTFVAASSTANFVVTAVKAGNYMLMDTSSTGNSADLVTLTSSGSLTSATVEQVFGGTNNVFDADGHVKGYAITSAAAESVATDSTPGHWEYYDTSTSAWQSLASASTSAAIFLSGDTRIRWNDNDTTHTALSGVAVDTTSAAVTGDKLDVYVSNRGGSSPYSLQVATLAAGAPVAVLQPNFYIADNVGSITGSLFNGGSTDDLTPTLSGVAGASEVITIRDGGSTIGTTVANASGGWSFTPTGLATGAHAFTVQPASGVESGVFTLTIGANQAPTLSSTTLSSPAGLLPSFDSYGTLLTVPNIEGPIAEAALPAGWTVAGSSPDTYNPTVGGPYGPINGTVVGGNYSGNAIGFTGGEVVGLTKTGLTVGAVYTFALVFQNTDTSATAVTITQLNASRSLSFGLAVGGGWQTVVYTFTATSTTENFTFQEAAGHISVSPILMDSTPSGYAGDLAPLLSSTVVTAATVAQVFASSNPHDSDGSIRGYAITLADAESSSADATPGHWEYYSTTTSSWISLAGVSASTAVFLAGDTRIRWSDNDTTHTQLSGVAVDNSSTAATGDVLDVYVINRGGSSPYSLQAATLAAGAAPIVLDLNHDGKIDYSHINFDVNLDGVQDHTAWAGANDGVLVWDKYGDGKIHEQSQFSFTAFGGSTDLQGLAAGFDSNHDGVFDARDAAFAQFSVWQDANQNGQIDAGEMQSLAALGITSISLQSDGVNAQVADGVTSHGNTAATLGNGQTMLVSDVEFAYTSEQNSVVDLSSLSSTSVAAGVADLSGNGSNTLKLSLSDVLSHAQSNLFITSDQLQFAVKGEAGDRVELSALLPAGKDAGTWTNLGEAVSGGVTYTVYENTTQHVDLLVQHGLTASFA